MIIPEIEYFYNYRSRYDIISENGYKPKLIFKGEYLNGLRHGKGEEYWPSTGELKFVGEYLNGKRNGKGKEYVMYEFQNFIPVYEGNYLNDKRHGEGKEYNGRFKFEGIYCYGCKSKGKFYVNDKLEYEGEYLYNKKWNGKGYDENGNVIYELINGNGKVHEYDYGYIYGLVYRGEVVNGRRIKNELTAPIPFSRITIQII